MLEFPNHSISTTEPHPFGYRSTTYSVFNLLQFQNSKFRFLFLLFITVKWVRVLWCDLAPYYHVGWTSKDLIKVVVNLEKWRIKFFINGRKVTISVFSTQSFMYSVSMCQIVNFSDFVIWLIAPLHVLIAMMWLYCSDHSGAQSVELAVKAKVLSLYLFRWKLSILPLLSVSVAFQWWYHCEYIIK